MSTLSAIVLVASSYFVCGFCLDLGVPLTDVQGSILKTLRDHAQRNIFRRVDQPKQFWFADPSLGDFVKSTEVRSSGANETGDVTLEVSFLRAANFTWVYVTNFSQVTYTLGKENYKGGIATTTSIDVNVNNNLYFLALLMQTKSFSILLYFKRSNITQAGVQAATHYYFSFDAPNTVEFDENGDLIFNVTLPSNYTNASRHFRIYYTFYINDDNEFDRESLSYEASSITGTSNTQITIRDAVYKTGGILSLHINDIDDLDTVSDTSFSRMFVVKEIDIRNNDEHSTKNIVTINPTTQSTYQVTGDDYIRYGSVLCSASGWPKPTVQITRDGKVMNTIVMSQTKILTNVYVPLDGKTKAEALGVYNCTATSGSKSATKQINVVE